jgi:hypothetical protein
MVEPLRSRRRLALLGICIALIALGVAATLALAGGSSNSSTEYVQASTLRDPSSPGRTLFSSSFANGDFAGWHLQSLPGRARIVHDEPYEGDSAARFEVRPGDVEPETGSSRSEVSGPTFQAGQDLYIRDAFRVPSADTFRGPWQIIQQLHETEWNGSPGVAVFLGTNKSLRLGAGDGSPTYWRGPKLKTGRWYDLVYRVKLSQDPKVGFVEVWLDGQRQRLTSGGFRAHGQTIQTNSTYLKVGIYRSSESKGVSVVEDDAVVVVDHDEARP